MSIVSPDPKIRRKKSGSQGASDQQLWKQGLYSGVKGKMGWTTKFWVVGGN